MGASGNLDCGEDNAVDSLLQLIAFEFLRAMRHIKDDMVCAQRGCGHEKFKKIETGRGPAQVVRGVQSILSG